MRFTTGERRRRLTQREVAETEIVQDLDLLADRGVALEEGHPFLDRHGEDVVNGLAAKRDLECLAVEAGAFARAAGHLDVGHEVELRPDHSFALTLLAAPAFDVEAESPRPVPALDGKGRLGEEIANGVVKADIGRWIGATVPSDRRLIDAHDLVHVLHALDGVVGARESARIY